MHLRNVTLAILAFSMFAFADDPVGSVSTFRDAYQVSVVTGLNAGDSFINVTNSGASSVLRSPDSICLNVYAFDPTEHMLACCSCLVPPNGMINLGVNRDILANVSGVLPTSAVIKMLATLPQSANIGCFASAALTASATFATGILAYRTTLHPSPSGGYVPTELQFSDAHLSQAELNILNNGCTALSKTGATCDSCRSGGI